MPSTDAQRTRIEPLLPDRAPTRGGRWRDHRVMIDAIAFTIHTGTQRVHLPEKRGTWTGVHRRMPAPPRCRLHRSGRPGPRQPTGPAPLDRYVSRNDTEANPVRRDDQQAHRPQPPGPHHDREAGL
ncbi:transposase [Streptomyces luteocolor]|uniref:transposase n=1 Tax=Streptomyces luteocolor TaxID=285500 RepID=UPI000D1AD124